MQHSLIILAVSIAVSSAGSGKVRKQQQPQIASAERRHIAPVTQINTDLQLFPFQQSGKWGYYDGSGVVVIRPQFDSASKFQEGLGAVGIEVTTGRKKDRKYGYVDRAGKFVISARYESASGFSKGLAAVSVNEKVGYIDKSGALLIRPQFDNGGEFSDEGAWVEVKDKYGFIDRTGQFIFPPRYHSFFGFSEGLAAVGIGTFPDLKYGYIDRTGQFIIEPRFDSAHNFSEGLAVVSVGSYPDKRDGFIDRTGRFVINPMFEHARSFSDGFAQVVVNKKWGHIDKSGNLIVTPEFAYTDSFSEGLAAVEVRRRQYGYVDATGKLVIAPQFDEAGPFQGGIARVITDDNVRYINRAGEFVLGTNGRTVRGGDRVSLAEQVAITQQVVTDGQLTASCIEEEGGAEKALAIEFIQLNRDQVPEFLVIGRGGCTCSARRCNQWLYRKSAGGYQLLLAVYGPEEISLLNSWTFGYRDVRVAYPPANDLSVFTELYKFDGKQYRETKPTPRRRRSL